MSTTCEDGSDKVSSVFDTVLASLLLVLLLVIVISNTMVLILYCYDRQLRVATNLFICMMVIADLLVGTTLVPSVMTRLDPCLRNNTALCAYKYALVCLFVALSLHFQTAIACDRWLAIKRPLQYTNIVTIKTAALVCVLIWINCICLFLVLPILWRNPSDVCLVWLVLTREYIVFVAIPLCILMCSIIMFCYASLFCTARRLTRVGHSRVSPEHHQPLPRQLCSGRESDMKAAKTLALVVLLNICTWVPALIFLIIMTVEDTDHSDALIRTATVFTFLPFANSAWNPWVYAMRLPAFRLATKRFSNQCAIKFRKRSHGSSNHETQSHLETVT